MKNGVLSKNTAKSIVFATRFGWMHAKLPKREKLKMAAHLKVDPPTDS